LLSDRCSCSIDIDTVKPEGSLPLLGQLIQEQVLLTSGVADPPVLLEAGELEVDAVTVPHVLLGVGLAAGQV